jgi:hypothetical protein
MNRRNRASASLLMLVAAATILPAGSAHDRQTEQHANADQHPRAPNIVIAPPANAVPAPLPYPPVWIPGTIPGQPPQAWFPAMPPTNNVDTTTPNGVLSGPPATTANIHPHRETPPGDLSREERESLKLACGNPEIQGVAAYRQCVTGQINVLRSAGARPDLDTLSPSERSSVELACVDAKRQGPALYDRCRAVHAREVHH